MKNRMITQMIFVITVFIFLLDFIAFKVIFPKNLVEGELQNIIACANQNQWNEAEHSVDRLINVWNKGKFALYFNYAEADYSLFLDMLSRTKGAVVTQDQTETISQALSSLTLWNNFIKIIPEP